MAIAQIASQVEVEASNLKPYEILCDDFIHRYERGFFMNSNNLKHTSYIYIASVVQFNSVVSAKILDTSIGSSIFHSFYKYITYCHRIWVLWYYVGSE